MTGKFSILMPTYNDESYILETINSVLKQTYKNWEIIIINDGSKDRTEQIIKSLNHKNITYLYQENRDQLNALKNGSQYITGDYVLLLHSDDLLASNETLENLANNFIVYPEVDGFYADYITIDDKSAVIGTLNTIDYNKEKVFKEVFWRRGDNNIGDTFVMRKSSFLKWTLPNYINQNTIYYIDSEMPQLKKIKPWYKYRVFSGNYINSDVGKFVVFNGTQRTIFKNYSEYSFPFYNFLFFPVINKFISKLKLYKAFNLKKNKEPNWNFLMVYYSFWRYKLVKQHYPELALNQIDKILDSLVKRKNKKTKKILLIEYKGERLYYGSDARIFYQDYNNGKVIGLYKQILEEDFDLIVVKNEETANAVRNVMLFYGLHYEVIYETDISKKQL